ncbi:MAG: hypothetical protein D6714_18295 [Bacteroidetes bacterium]|nr:MAG: hypothetical protein D6714_18295 [Bacteroidota bacterium]
MKSPLLCLFLCLGTMVFTQNETMTLPYRQIPDAPESYTAEAVAARMIDGLGYRYYWATEGLRPDDLAFRPTEESRSTDETLDHILGLSTAILNATTSTPNVRSGGGTPERLSFAEKRRRTLENLRQASDNLRAAAPGAMADMKIIFQRGENRSEFPFWNILNGQLADALWHTGQVVSHRRTSGNPINPKVNVFRGKTRE